MYESHFGLSALPFRLGPDHAFYFASRVHGLARETFVSALRSDAGVTVLTGEIGAGKTTLVRSALAELDLSAVVLGQLVSTRLDAAELTVALGLAFGLSGASGEAPGEPAALLRFLVGLDKAGRRALLVIDEAQNLADDAFLLLARLATRRQPRALPLQLVLVGQPELQERLRSSGLVSLRRAIGEHCHLRALDGAELEPYVLHRLRKVGWTGDPAFDPGCFAEMYRWTGGIPRRVNVLCNRLLVAQALAPEASIDASAVARTGAELQAEFGATDWEPQALDSTATSTPVVAPRFALGRHGPGGVLCVASSHGGHVRAAAWMQAWSRLPHVCPARLVSMHADGAAARCAALFPPDVDLALCLGPDLRSASAQDLRLRFGQALDALVPRAVICFDGSPDDRVIGEVVVERGLTFIEGNAGAASTAPGVENSWHRLDHAADLLFTVDAQSTRTLADRGVPRERIHCVGNLLADAIDRVLEAPSAELPDGGLDPRLAALLLEERNGYAVVVAGRRQWPVERRAALELLHFIGQLSRDCLVVWPMHPDFAAHLERLRLDDALAGSRVLVIAPRAYPGYVHLIGGANCVLTDSPAAQDETTILGIPCLTYATSAAREVTVSMGSNTLVGWSTTHATQLLWQCMYSGGKRGSNPPLWDGAAGSRMAFRTAQLLASGASADTGKAD